MPEHPKRPEGDRLTVPHPARLSPGRPDYRLVLAAHAAALAAGDPTYVDPSTGLLVMTARALIDRGFCCESGCRHCPWIDRPPA